MAFSVNHIAPSGPSVMRSGELSGGRLPYSVIDPADKGGAALVRATGVGLDTVSDPPPAHAVKREINIPS